MYLDRNKRPRYCWRCRKRVGHGPGPQVCAHCKCYNARMGAARNYVPRDDIEERVAYYAARAEMMLDLFAESPCRRLPGAHNRLGERQTKLAGTTGRVATAHEIEKLPE